MVSYFGEVHNPCIPHTLRRFLRGIEPACSAAIAPYPIASGNRCRRAPGGTSRNVCGMPRIMHFAEVADHRAAAIGNSCRFCLPRRMAACTFQLFDHRGILVRNAMLYSSLAA